MASPLYCPNCNTQILADDINIKHMVAKCANCHTVFDFDGQEMQPTKRERPNIPLPKGFELQQMLSEMSIIISWRKTKHLFFYVLFTVIWNVVTLPFVLMAVVTSDWIMALMISLHATVGISFLYYTLALIFNKTVIDISTHGIAIVTKPLNIPFNRNRYINARDLDQLFVEQYVESTTNNRPNYAYCVRAVIKNESKRPKIIKGLKDENQALYIEHEIEKFLHIEDRMIR